MIKLNQSDGGKKIFRSYVRRSSLDMLFKVKNNFGPESEGGYRKSCSSFDKIKSARYQDSVQVKLQKDSDNIYFNPQSRANYFKNLIDGYFIKNQQNPNNIKQSYSKSPSKSSYLFRKSLSDRKSENAQKSLDLAYDSIVSKQEYCHQKKIKSQFFQLNNKFVAHSGKKQAKQNDKSKVPLRYRQQNRGHLLVEKHQVFPEQGALSNQIQERVLQPPSPHPRDPFHLPRITQAIDDDISQGHSHHVSQSNLEFIQTSDSLMRGASNLSFSQRSKTNKKVIQFQNSISRVYKVTEGSQRLIIKQFRDYVFVQRHNKALSHGVRSVWWEYRFDVLSLCTDYTCSLRDCLYRMYPNPTSPNSLILQPTPLHSKLLANHCQQLYILFRQLILQLIKTQSSVINNKITLSNLYLSKDSSRLIIGDWQHSSFKGECEIRQGLFQSRTEPILRCEDQWLVEPEYLATEILQSMSDERGDDRFDLWQGGGNVSDVYSLGLAFLQIVTLVPLTACQPVSIRSYPGFRPREGYLSSANRSISTIAQRQKTLVKRISVALQRQINQNQKNPKLFSLLLRMIQPSRQKRITFDQLMQQVH